MQASEQLYIAILIKYLIVYANQGGSNSYVHFVLGVNWTVL